LTATGGDAGIRDVVVVYVNSTSGTSQIKIKAIETGANTDEYHGRFRVREGASSKLGKKIRVLNASTLYVEAKDDVDYNDKVVVYYGAYVNDSTPPEVNITYPVNGTNISDNTLDVNYTFSDAGVGVDSCWYSNDSYSKNVTLASCGTNITDVVWIEGQHNVTVWVNDSANNVNWSSVSFSVDAPVEEGDSEDSASGGSGGSASENETEVEENVTEEEVVILKDFSVDKGIIEVVVTQGDSIEEEMIIENSENVSQSFEILVSFDIKEFVSVSESNFVLGPYESKNVKIVFSPNQSLGSGVYTGNLKIKTDDKKKEVLISSEVERKIEEVKEEEIVEEGAEEKKRMLFDIFLDILDKHRAISPGEELLLKIGMINLGDPVEVKIPIKYIIKDFDNNIVVQKSDKKSIYKNISFLERIELPENLRDGDYVAIVEINYDGLKASSSRTFNVKKDKYVLLEFEYEDGEINLINKSLEEGKSPTILHEAGKEYNVNLYSSDGEVLYSFSFDNPGRIFSDGSRGAELYGGVMELEKIKFYVPVLEDKKSWKIEILKNEEEILEEEIYMVGAKSCRLR